MTSQGLGDWVILGGLLLGAVLVFPWVTSAYMHRRRGGDFPILGMRTAIVGAFLLAVSAGLALAGFLHPW
jgi:hypothetical protein